MLFQIELVVKLVVKLHSTQFNYHYLEFVSATIMNNCDDLGRGVLPIMAYTPEEEVRFRPKGISFLGLRYMIGQRITCCSDR